ncbi:MAG: CcmD family protein [Bacteroidota bacterium]
MKKASKLIILFLLLLSTNLYSQGSQSVEMADALRQSGKIYTVVFGLVIILTGMIFLLLRVDRKIAQLEKTIKKSTTASKKTLK